MCVCVCNAPANISYMHYRALEFVNPVPFHVQIVLVLLTCVLSQNPQKMYLQIIITLR